MADFQVVRTNPNGSVVVSINGGPPQTVTPNTYASMTSQPTQSSLPSALQGPQVSPQQAFQNLANASAPTTTTDISNAVEQAQNAASKVDVQPPTPVSSSYNPLTGMTTTQNYDINSHALTDTSSFYGFPSGVGGSMTTATSNPPANLPTNDISSIIDAGAAKNASISSTLEGALVSGAIGGTVGTLMFPFVVGDTLLKSVEYGPGYGISSIEKGLGNIATEFATNPLFSIVSAGTTIATGAGLGYGISALTSPEQIASIGTANINPLPSFGDNLLRYEGTATISTPHLNTVTLADFKIVSPETTGEIIPSLERAELTAITPNKWLSKIFGEDIMTVRTTDAGSLLLNIDLDKGLTGGVFETATVPKSGISVGVDLNKLVMEDNINKIDVWQSAIASKTGDTVFGTFLRTDIAKDIPDNFWSSGGSTGTILEQLTDTKNLADLTAKLGAAANDLIKDIPTGSTIPLLTPTSFTGLTTPTKTDNLDKMLTISTTKTDNINKMLSITTTGTKNKQNTVVAPTIDTINDQFKGLGNLVNPIQISYQMPTQVPSSFQMPSEIQTPVQMPTEISIPKSIETTTFKTPAIPNTIPTITTPTIFPDFNLPSFGFGEGKKWKMGSINLKMKYKPSLAAIGEGIFARGRTPKLVSGLEIRPIMINRRKRL